jgi:uncharacterized protein
MADRADGSAAGRVRPISQFVLKVHSRCDLACDHCYVYEHADQSWRGRPIGIKPAVARQAALRIAQHAAAHRLPVVRVVLHGGEPLLLGEPGLRLVLSELHEQISPAARLDLCVQTNGVLLSPPLCDLFAEYGVRIGVSLDGDRAANDRHRRYADGRSSHDHVRRALRLLRTPAYKHLYSGILCTVDIANDPVAVLNALVEERPPRIDFLLPHANWDRPPPRPHAGATAYADWLTRVFDHWNTLGRPMPVRLFDSIEALAVGGTSESEGIGPGPVDLLVIETDGEWEQVDSLKSAYDGAAATELNVFDHAADEAAAYPAVAARQDGIEALCETCRSCPVVELCGGGLYSHRYRSESGFQNPSVYCDDLKALIEHVGTSEHPVGGAPAGPGSARDELSSPAYSALDRATLDAIAEAPVDGALARLLSRNRLATTRVLFAKAGELSSACGDGKPGGPGAAWELLCALGREAPDSVQKVLEHPFAREWAVRRLDSSSDCEQFCVTEHAHLASFALAAAVRAEAQAELTVPLRDGVLYLPTLGAWDLGRPADRTVRVALQDGAIHALNDGSRAQLRLRDLAADGPGWSVAREIGRAEHRVSLEDLDPHRDGHGLPLADRLSAVEVQRWHEMLSGASDALESWAPEHAAQVRACVRTLVPLVPETAGHEISATSRHVFGAFGVALPARPEALAMLMVHETQHMVLDTLLDMHDLVDPADARGIRVAWRPDARPPSAVLHGAFAVIGMAEVWQARGSHGSQVEQDTARTWVRKYVEGAGEALDRLAQGDALPPAGARFSAGLRRRMRRLG